jgi:outer membrane protein assembly factor BamB
MKRLFLVMLIYGLMVTCLKGATSSASGKLIVTHGSSVTVYSMKNKHILWSIDTGIAPANPWVVHEGSKGVLLVNGSEQVAAYDIATGDFLWKHQGFAGSTHMTSDVHHQLYNNPILYPFGFPKRGPDSAPVITISKRSADSSTTWLVDSHTGEEFWSRSDDFETHATQFIPTSSGSYDLIFTSGPKFTGTGGDMFRVDGSTGRTILWSRHFSNRSGIPVPDITGDGQYDFFAEPSNWSSVVLMLDGTTGDTVWRTSYGCFDVIQTPQVVARENGGYDIIVSAQLSCSGGIRRYRAEDRTVVWDSMRTYNNNTIFGLLERADGMTILSGWRHRSKAIALDAATGKVLWNDVPLDNSDTGAIGVPDMTSDGNEDIVTISGGYLRLYDGITGTEQRRFAPIEADGVAYSLVPESATRLLLASVR